MAKVVTTTLPELLVEGDDHKFRQMIYDVLAFSARLDAVRNGLGSLVGLTGSQYSVLITVRMLEGEGNSTGVIDIAEYLHVSGAFVTSEVNKLTKQGFVSKITDPSDRRRVRLSITTEGEALLADLTTDQIPINNTLFANITRAEFDTLCTILPKLVAQGDEALNEIDYRLRKSERRERVG